mmetsp:Transcript_2816/g.10130  ORF Transcript_2816/g.10130 Transcript_2816/m.10130 type:complete len:296 (-) Transcript_2816:57-944(-)
MFAHQQRVFLSSNQFGGRSHLLLPRICVDGARDEPCDVLVRICIVVRRFVRVVKKRSRWSSSRGDVDATRRLDCKARRHGGTRACLWTSDGGRRRNQRPCDGRGRGSRPAARSHVGRVPRARCATQGCQGMHVHDDASGKASRSAIRSAGQEDHEPSRPKCTCTATAPGTRRNDGRNQQQLVEALRPVVQRTRRRRSEHCFQDIGILLERVRGWTRRSGHCRCSRRGTCMRGRCTCQKRVELTFVPWKLDSMDEPKAWTDAPNKRIALCLFDSVLGGQRTRKDGHQKAWIICWMV